MKNLFVYRLQIVLMGDRLLQFLFRSNIKKYLIVYQSKELPTTLELSTKAWIEPKETFYFEQCKELILDVLVLIYLNYLRYVFFNIVTYNCFNCLKTSKNIKIDPI